MKQVNISNAKAQLSRHLAYVKAGGRVRIVDRDTPIADLVPVDAGSGSPDDDDALLCSLEKRGLGRRASREPLAPELLRAGPGKSGRARLAKAVLDERRSSW